jgi:hypothetical protein
MLGPLIFKKLFQPNKKPLRGIRRVYVTVMKEKIFGYGVSIGQGLTAFDRIGRFSIRSLELKTVRP